MRKIAILMIAFSIAIAFVGGALAQSFPPVLLNVPFWQWPALRSASENLVVKRGINIDGTVNDKIYLRIGWDEACLGIHLDEWQTLVDALQQDRYINMRDYAEAAMSPDEWGPDDDHNCPDDPGDGTGVEDYVF